MVKDLKAKRPTARSEASSFLNLSACPRAFSPTVTSRRWSSSGFSNLRPLSSLPLALVENEFRGQRNQWTRHGKGHASLTSARLLSTNAAPQGADEESKNDDSAKATRASTSSAAADEALLRGSLAVSKQKEGQLIPKTSSLISPEGEGMVAVDQKKRKQMLATLRAPPSTQAKLTQMLQTLPGAINAGVSGFNAWCARFAREFAANPRGKLAEIRGAIAEEIDHYRVGSKLLWADVKIASGIALRLTSGKRLTRREHKQLVRTTTDLLRLVPMSVFVLVPFMEFLLPFALKVFPNMLPSTFQDSLKREQAMKNELKMRLAMAGFMKDMLREMAKDLKKTPNHDNEDDEGASAQAVTNFVAKAKRGSVNNEDIFKFAKLFKDDLTLDNMSRTQLVTLCTFMKLPPYGADAFMRYNLRSHIREIQNDDQRILFEGLESLNRSELQEASRERGMRSLGMSKQELQHQLQEWLDLSCNRQVPISLLILSRSFALSSDYDSLEGNIAQSISALDQDTVTEVLLDAATPEERRSKEIRELTLHSYEHQAELIAEEKEERDKDLQAIAKAKQKEQTKETVAATSAAAVAAAADDALGPSAPQASPPYPTQDTGSSSAEAIVQGAEPELKEAVEVVGPTLEQALSGKADDDDERDQQTQKEALHEGAAALLPTQEQQDQQQLEAGIPAEAAQEASLDEPTAAAEAGQQDDDDDDEDLAVEDLEALATFASCSAVDDEKLSIERLKKAVKDIRLDDDDDDDEAAHASAADEQGAEPEGQVEADAEAEAEAALLARDDAAAGREAEVETGAGAGGTPGEDKEEEKGWAAGIANPEELAEDTRKAFAQPQAEEKEEQQAAQPEDTAAAPAATTVAASTTTATAFGVEAADAATETEAAAAWVAAAEESSGSLEKGVLAAAKAKAFARGDVAKLEGLEAAERELEEEEVEEARDAVLDRISGSLSNMLSKLETDIAKVDEAIGEKMHVLDLDSDGLLSESELIAVLQTMMRTKLTEEEAQRKVRKLMEDIDRDCDGVVSVEELRSWVQVQRRKKDVEVHERSLEAEKHQVTSVAKDSQDEHQPRK